MLLLAPEIKAVCFDAFGTLVEIADRRHVGARLMRLAPKDVRSNLKRRLLVEDRPPEHWGSMIVNGSLDNELNELTTDWKAELISVRMRPRMDLIWRTLRGRGLGLGVCSNLAAPFGPPVLRALPDKPDVTIFSYQAGLVKPEPEIYAEVIRSFDLPAEHILFVGDTKSADVDGPAAAGMPSMLISHFEPT